MSIHQALMMDANYITWGGLSRSFGTSGTVNITFEADGNIGTNTSDSRFQRILDYAFAAEHEIRYTSYSGTLTKNTALTEDVWYQLNTTRSLGAGGTKGAADKNGIYTVEIRRINDTVVSTGTLTITLTGSA